MSLFSKKKPPQNPLETGMQLGVEIIDMQLRLAANSKDFYDRLHTDYALGYCFGIYQAALEVVEKGSISAETYNKYIRTGFIRTFANENIGTRNFDYIRQRIQQPDCAVGRNDGAAEYVEFYNKKTTRGYALVQFLLSGAST